MAINIGATGSAGRFIGGGAGVVRDTQLKLLFWLIGMMKLLQIIIF
tara:strand:- start:18 stop:155 length:138 start_codon:yes stop_codon:yes gene_type:complete